MPNASQATLKGTVRAKDGSALPGVMITIAGLTVMGVEIAVTNADGSYEADSLQPGRYLATAQMAGFVTVEREMDVTPPATVVDFTLSLDLGR